MKNDTQELTFFLPGLGTAETRGYMHFTPYPALERLLARADRHALNGQGHATCLSGLFGLDETKNLPIAALSRLGEGDEPTACEGAWLRADPVHLLAQQDRLYLTHHQGLVKTLSEARLFAETFNAHYKAQGWRLEVAHPDRWYLGLPESPRLKTTPPWQALGLDILPCLPQGEERSLWRQIFNECQMLLHQAPANRARIERGEVEVNSLWFWGEGELAHLDKISPRFDAMFSDIPLSRGLGRWQGIPVYGLTDSAGWWGGRSKRGPAGARAFVHSEGLWQAVSTSDRAGCIKTLAAWEKDWFVPAMRAIKTGRLQRIIVLTDHHRYLIGRRELRRFWRWPKALCLPEDRSEG